MHINVNMPELVHFIRPKIKLYMELEATLKFPLFFCLFPIFSSIFLMVSFGFYSSRFLLCCHLFAVSLLHSGSCRSYSCRWRFSSSITAERHLREWCRIEESHSEDMWESWIHLPRVRPCEWPFQRPTRQILGEHRRVLRWASSMLDCCFRAHWRVVMGF